MQGDLSFKIYSDERLSEIAAAVAEEEEKLHGDHEIYGEFEFAVGDSPIGVYFPLFKTEFFSISEKALISTNKSEPRSRIEVSIRDLFIDDRDQNQSDSSSEEDELEKLPPESYCIWPPPPPVTASLKSGSSRSASLRWKLKNFLRRSNSDGSWKNNLGHLNPKLRQQRMEKSSFRANGERNSPPERRRRM